MPPYTHCNNNLSVNRQCDNKKMYGGGNKKKGLVSSIGKPVMMFSIISKRTSKLNKSIFKLKPEPEPETEIFYPPSGMYPPTISNLEYPPSGIYPPTISNLEYPPSGKYPPTITI